jgi:hypothetical protein
MFTNFGIGTLVPGQCAGRVENAMSSLCKIGGVARSVPLRRRAFSPRALAASASLLAALSITFPAAAQSVKVQTIKVTAQPAARGEEASHPHVYLMRGLLNIFSLGMDQLASQLARNGIDASVYNHSVEETVVGTIVQKYRAGDHGPYILVGHSLGADAVMAMAQQLDAAGVPVALVVPFDGTESFAAPSNVGCVLNLTQRKYAYMQAGTGFHGKLSNVDVSSDTTIDHITIDKSPRLQAMAMTAILQAAHGQSCRPAGAPLVAKPKEQAAPKEASPKQVMPAKPVAPERSASRAKNAAAPNSAAPAATASPNPRAGNEG